MRNLLSGRWQQKEIVKDISVSQYQIAEAEATLGASRSYLYEAVKESWEAAQDPDYRIGSSQRIKLQLAATNAIQSSAKVVDLVHELTGLSGARRSQRFQKYFRDIHTITQYAFTSKSRYQDVGRLMLGLDPEWGFFYF